MKTKEILKNKVNLLESIRLFLIGKFESDSIFHISELAVYLQKTDASAKIFLRSASARYSINVKPMYWKTKNKDTYQVTKI